MSTEAAELPVTVVLNKADLVPAQECSAALAEVCAPLQVATKRASLHCLHIQCLYISQPQTYLQLWTDEET